MGAEGAVGVLYRKDIQNSDDPESTMKEKMDEYTEAFANPYEAAAHGLVDDVIEPADTRMFIAQSLEILKAKREQRPQKKHGLIPL
jgi:acetyl-CoA carboxylase carboxyltransferase component